MRTSKLDSLGLRIEGGGWPDAPTAGFPPGDHLGSYRLFPHRMPGQGPVPNARGAPCGREPHAKGGPRPSRGGPAHSLGGRMGLPVCICSLADLLVVLAKSLTVLGGCIKIGKNRRALYPHFAELIQMPMNQIANRPGGIHGQKLRPQPAIQLEGMSSPSLKDRNRNWALRSGPFPDQAAHNPWLQLRLIAQHNQGGRR